MRHVIMHGKSAFDIVGAITKSLRRCLSNVCWLNYTRLVLKWKVVAVIGIQLVLTRARTCKLFGYWHSSVKRILSGGSQRCFLWCCGHNTAMGLPFTEVEHSCAWIVSVGAGCVRIRVWWCHCWCHAHGHSCGQTLAGYPHEIRAVAYGSKQSSP